MPESNSFSSSATDNSSESSTDSKNLEGNVQNVLAIPKNGRYNHHLQLDPNLKEDIKNHINSIPRIESHYVRSTTQRENIDGCKTITQLYKDFD